MKCKKLTRAERSRILLACELVETKAEFSCLAVCYGYCCLSSDQKRLPKQMGDLTARYAAFYEQDSSGSWGFSSRREELGKTQRILALLLFMEVNG